jgi:hypothetical protein
MYFIKRGGTVCHVVRDARNGAAPCGVKMTRLDLSSLKAGKPTPHVAAQKPPDVPLCKHCEKQLD